MIEITSFRLKAATVESEFLAADKSLQEDFAYLQPGLLRRTTAKSSTGAWVVIDLWSSAGSADSCGARWDSDPVVQRFMSFIDRSTFVTERYSTID